MKITIDFPDETIDRWLSHAVYDWADMRGSRGDWRSTRARFWFAYDTETDKEGDMTGRAHIGRRQVAAGIAAMAKDVPSLFSQMVEGNDDMDTCDALWQCIVFGKMIYG